MIRLLIIDDDKLIRDSIREIFLSENFIIDEAKDGFEGIEKSDSNQYDIVICDIEMPRVDGYQVITKLKENPNYLTVPFIFLSGLVNMKDIVYGLKLGADDYITKPFDINEIRQTVHNKLIKKEKIDSLIRKKNDEIQNALNLTIPHEMLTPLNGIIGTVSLLLQESDSYEESELKEFHNIIYLSSIRLKNSIEKFIIFNELTNLKVDTIIEEEISIQDLVNESYNSLILNSDRKLDFIIDINPVVLISSRRLLLNCLNEIISNCIKFSFPGQKINIVGQILEDSYLLEFTDFGIGISKEQIIHIDSLVQFDRKTNEQQGIGIGITIIKMIAKALNIKFEINSEKGEFTNVKLFFPLLNEN